MVDFRRARTAWRRPSGSAAVWSWTAAAAPRSLPWRQRRPAATPCWPRRWPAAPALYGVLGQIEALGLELLEVRRLAPV